MVSLNPTAMHSLPIKHLLGTAGFVGAVLRWEAYDGTRPLGPGCSGDSGRNAILAALMGMVPNSRDGGRQRDDNNPGMIAA